MGFIFGGSTGIKSPEELEQRRAIVRNLMARNAAEPPKDLWSGLRFLTGAIGGRLEQSRLDKAEEEGRAGADASVNDLLGRFGTKPAVTPASYSPGEQTGLDGVKKAVANSTGSWLNSQLANDPDLKLTPAAAAGITGNLDAETGGFKHMQELNPVVPGSRGGFGFAQWTGPRRKAFEAWAGQQGMDPTSKEANFGFLKHELMDTPEGKVLASLNGVTDPTQAAQIFSSQYLRPGVPRMDNRVAAAQRYAGGGGAQPTIEPAADKPVQVADAGTGPGLNDLMRAYSNPWTSENQRDVLKLYIQQKMQEADPVRQQELEKGRLEIEALKNPKDYDYTTLPDGTVLRVNKRGGPVEQVYKGQQKPTDDIAEYQYYVEQTKAAGGTPVPFDQFMQSMKKAGAMTINTATGEPADVKLRNKLQEKEADTWSNYQTAATQSAGLTQQLDVMDELLKMAPQGAIQGRLAQMFPGFSTAGDAVISMANRIAPSFRVPGSGAQSDKELDGFLSSLPRLQTTPGGNAIISATLRAKAAIDMERGNIVDAYADGSISAPEARKRMKELNNRSIMTPELQAIINSQTGQKSDRGKGDARPSPLKGGSAPDADGWITLPNGTQVREVK